MKSIQHALIMAAGRGLRMMPLTADIPKAMAAHDGSTLIASGIEKLRGSIDNIHITVGYKGAMLARHVIEHKVTSVFNTEGHGNAWWIFNTLMKHVNEPVLVLTCDNVVDIDTRLLLRDYEKKGCPACMLVPVRPVEGLEGDFIFHNDGRVTAIDRKRPTDIYCSGIQILNPSAINASMPPQDSFYEVWRSLIAQQQLFCSEVYPSRWFTVDTTDQLEFLNTKGPT